MGLIEVRSEVQEAYFKGIFYGGPGSGKTFTALTIATKLGKTAIVDTERGVEPYVDVFNNPDGSPLGVVSTRSAKVIYKEVIPEAVRDGYKCLIVDQVSTIWEDSKDQYIYREFEKQSKAWKYIERNGKPPFQGWSFIKGPFRRMIRELMSTPMHVFILSRLADEFKVTPEGEPIKVGEVAATEKNTMYEPSVRVKMQYDKVKKEWLAYVETDKWRELAGKIFVNPTIEMIKPILKRLGKVHAKQPEPEIQEVDGSEDIIIKPNTGQEKLISVLAKKGGIPHIAVEKFLEKCTREEASQAVNEMTVGNY
ncbi:MAG: AAA family ATPase, partial [Bacteroidetes bacterium]|nr:AAA family ATPase [Bacteroidota bacterium]